MVDHDINLHHHGDREATEGLVDFAVNVYGGPRPVWLNHALRAGIEAAGVYPDPSVAEAAISRRHGRTLDEVLATSGAAEAFTLIARWRPWRKPVVVHPQFTEPHAALLAAGHAVTEVRLTPPFTLDPERVPHDADLVVVGNPTNPTGVLHPAATIRSLSRTGRTVVVDEAFMDAVPGELESLTGEPGVIVLRSLTKHWGIPGVRAGYVLGAAESVAELRRQQTPWSVSAPAIAAMIATTTDQAVAEAERRAKRLQGWLVHLERTLAERGITHIASSAPFVLARAGDGIHGALRDRGIAVRRADSFPGLDSTWVRIAVRDRKTTDTLATALDDALG